MRRTRREPSRWASWRSRRRTSRAARRHAFRENFLSVVPKIEIEDGRVTRVTMLPIELHFGCDWSVNGLPRTADAEAAKTIAATLSRLSSPYGTHIAQESNGTIIARSLR